MENASDALIMAGQVLIFIIALTVCISSFTTLRIGIDDTIGQTETVKMAKDSAGYINYIDSQNANAARVVGVETVVSSMTRSIKENYVVYLKLKLNAYDKNSLTNRVGVTFYQAGQDLIIDSVNLINKGDDLIKITIGRNSNSDTNAILSAENAYLYKLIKNAKFYEYLGEFQNDNAGVSSENKQKFRIITYIQI